MPDNIALCTATTHRFTDQMAHLRGRPAKMPECLALAEALHRLHTTRTAFNLNQALKALFKCHLVTAETAQLRRSLTKRHSIRILFSATPSKAAGPRTPLRTVSLKKAALLALLRLVLAQCKPRTQQAA